MESDQLVEGERKPVPSNYSSTYKAGQQAPKFTQKTVIGEASGILFCCYSCCAVVHVFYQLLE